MKYVIADIRFDNEMFHTEYNSTRDMAYLGSMYETFNNPVMKFNSLREANAYLSSLNPANARRCIIMSIEEAFKYEKDMCSL